MTPANPTFPTPFPGPRIPTQPNLQQYTLQQLGLFQVWTRASLRQQFPAVLFAPGLPAGEWPDYDLSRPPKLWADGSADPTAVNVAYPAALAPGATTFSPLALSGFDAATLNLPGRILYPVWMPAPTSAVSVAANGAITTLNPMFLSTLSQAQTVLAQKAFSGYVLDDSWDSEFNVSYPDTEPRRQWGIKANAPGAQVWNVGALLHDQYAMGIGFPGSWGLSNTGPLWTSMPLPPDGSADSRPAVAMPCRALLGNEQIQNGLVIRTDVDQPVPFSQSDRANIQAILAAVSKQS